MSTNVHSIIKEIRKPLEIKIRNTLLLLFYIETTDVASELIFRRSINSSSLVNFNIKSFAICNRQTVRTIFI
jgi:hypothetical protein